VADAQKLLAKENLFNVGAPQTACAWPFDVLTRAGSEKGGDEIGARQGAIGFDLLIGWKGSGADERAAAGVITQSDLGCTS
jgi:hypothetical protein